MLKSYNDENIKQMNQSDIDKRSKLILFLKNFSLNIIKNEMTIENFIYFLDEAEIDEFKILSESFLSFLVKKKIIEENSFFDYLKDPCQKQTDEESVFSKRNSLGQKLNLSYQIGGKLIKKHEISNIKLDEYHKQLFNLKSFEFEKYGTIPHDKIEELFKLGEGGFGEVWEGRLNKYTPIAIKKINKKSNESSILKIFKEVDLMNKIKHPKLIHFYGFWKDKNDRLCLIMDICKGGDLSHYLHKRVKLGIRLTMTQRFEILKDIAEGICQFHMKNIIHRDIKCDNILISDVINDKTNFNAFLSDYGEAVEMDIIIEKLKSEVNLNIGENLLWSEYNGTIQYAPQEILEGNIKKLSIKSDIYSFGSVLYEIFTEKIPYEEQKLDGFELSLRIITQKIKPDTSQFIENTPQEIITLINECWNDDPNKRPKIADIIENLIKIQKNYNFTNDFSVIRDKIEKKCFSEDKTSGLYVLPKGSYSESSKESFDLYDHVIKNFIENHEKKMLLLVGGSGSGKSLFTKFLQDNIIKQHKNCLSFRADLNIIKQPYSNLIEEVLSIYDIEEEEKEKLKNMKIVFIFDGYDEISGCKNIYNTNNLRFFPNAKLIISCRDEYLLLGGVKEKFGELFYPDHDNKRFKQIYIKNFGEEETNNFIKNFINIKRDQEDLRNFIQKIKDKSDPVEYYSNIIKSLNESLPILSSPFLLDLICRIIPSNEAFHETQNFKNLKRLTIYELFLDIIYRNEYKRRNSSTGNEVINFKSILVNEKIKEMLEFSEDLACDLFCLSFISKGENLFSCIYKDENNIDHVFNKYFDNDSKTKFFFKSTLLKEIEHGKWNFSHKSIMEYFVSKRIIKEIKGLSSKCLLDIHLLKKIIANNIYLSENPSILNFIVDYLLLNPEFEKTLWKYLYLTRKTNGQNKNIIDKLASNCITILNFGHKDLSNRDYSNLRFPQADLRECNLYNSKFVNTVMMGCILKQTNLQNCTFANADLSNILIGQLPTLNYKFKVFSTIFSNCGKYLAVGLEEGSVIIYHSTNILTELKKLKDHSAKIFNLAFSPKSNFLASCSGDKSVIIYEVNKNFEEIKRLNDHYDAVRSVVFSLDNNYIASGGFDMSVIIYDLRNDFSKIRQFNDHFSAVFSLAFSYDNQYFASASGDYSIIIYDMNENFSKNKILNHSHWVTSIAFSSDSKFFASGSVDKSVRIYDPRNGFIELKRLDYEIDFPLFSGVSFSNDSRFFCSFFTDNKVRIYDLYNNFTNWKILSDHSQSINSVTFSYDSRYIATASTDKSVIVHDLIDNLSELKNYNEDKVAYFFVVFSPDNKLLATGGKTSVVIYDLKNDFKELRLFNCFDDIFDLLFSPDSKLLVVFTISCTVVLDSGKGFEIIKIFPHFSKELFVFSQDSLRIWTFKDQTIIIFDTKNDFSEFKRFSNLIRNVNCMALSLDSKFVALSLSFENAHSVQICDMNNEYQELLQLQDHTELIFNILFSHDSRIIATVSKDKSVILYDIQNNFTILKIFKEMIDVNKNLIFSPYFRYFATIFNDEMNIYDFQKDFSILPIKKDHFGKILSLAFSFDFRFIATIGSDGSFIIYEFVLDTQKNEYDSSLYLKIIKRFNNLSKKFSIRNSSFINCNMINTNFQSFITMEKKD